jgi:hypothetical protein
VIYGFIYKTEWKLGLDRANPRSSNLLLSCDMTFGHLTMFHSTILGDSPVSVIKGDAATESLKRFERAFPAGKGTEEQRRLTSNYVAAADDKQLWLQFKQLRLSRNSILVDARESWHNVQLYQPFRVAQKVKWCLDEFEKLEKG